MASELENLNPSARIMTFHPTMEEFKNFSRYIAYIESQGAHRAGLAKVVPPKEWKPRRWYDDIDDLSIPAPIQQVVTGQSGLFTQYNIQKKAMTVREFRKIANNDKYCTPRYTDFEDLERKYWKNLTFNAPIYGADVNGTLYDKHIEEWNIGHLNTILDIVENESGITIEGVNTPYLYFGMWKTSFAWHTEDMDLYSINYLHFGEPKSWYSIPPEHGKRLERLAKGFFPGSAQSCEAFLRHKMTLISPSILKKYGIPFDKCSCRKDMVKISMDVFVRKYQPERYKLWKAGKDVTVIDHTLPTPEAAEFFKGELLQKVQNEKHCPEETEPEEECKADGDMEKRSVTKHRIGTKRHRVCLEVPHEVSQSEAFPKEELGPVQFDMDVAESPVGPAREPVPQGDQGLAPPEYADSSEVKFEELKNVKLDEEEEEPEAAVLDLSISHSVTSALTPSGMKQGSGSSLQSGSPLCSASSGSECLDLPRQALEQAEVLTVHSYAKEDANGMDDVQPSGKKASVNEQELAKMAKEYIRSVKDRKKSKGRRQPLSKLPRHHPLLVNDGLSDDEMSEQLATEEEMEEAEAWAKPLSQLWQNRPPNFEAEKEYNAIMAEQAPYCAVCMLFQTYQADCGGQSSQAVPDAADGKMRTKPLIPEMCFTTTGCSTDVSLSTPYLEEDGTSLLITCKRCRVRVHASCYGVAPEKATEDWKCSRCKANALEEDCCLCSLRGGALQKANDNKWVHVMCAVAVLEAKFVNIAERSPVDVSKIPLQRFRLKCVFCKKRRKRIAGCCVQCSHGRCPTSFHVSCAQAAGVMMQPDDWPFVVFITCFRHKIPSQAERAKAALQDLTVGQAVISKHKNGRFYQCEVISLTKETFYEVNFDDGSFSDNLYPEDIVSRDCLQLGPPAGGEVVQVRWTDGQVYGATFVASHVIQMYQVEFEDGSQLMAKRDDVYTLNEELPKRVKSRLSVASDMRFTEIFTEKEVKQERKRQRVINSRYREDYIEPALYRAIME
ncbi:Lysine-specific demethylase 4A [Varanus komodoensis]|nr:Lysine-specific demethylase 4A [Varanus komodoensis]